MAFKPLHDRVLVRRVQSEEKTKGGLIIPDNAKEKPAEGEIIFRGRRRAQGFGRTDRTVGFRWRPRPVRQMVGHRSHGRRRRAADHEGKANILGVLS